MSLDFNLQLTDLQANDELKNMYMYNSSPSTEEFWIALQELLKQLDLHVCGMFLTNMVVWVSVLRDKLTHEHIDQIMWIATTGLQANIKKIAHKSQANYIQPLKHWYVQTLLT